MLAKNPPLGSATAATAEATVDSTKKLIELMNENKVDSMTALALVKDGADPDAQDQNGDTILHHLAVMKYQEEDITGLVRTYKASVGIRNNQNLTPLQKCLNTMPLSLSRVLLLIGLGANPNDRNPSNQSILMKLFDVDHVDKEYEGRCSKAISHLLKNKSVNVSELLDLDPSLQKDFSKVAGPVIVGQGAYTVIYHGRYEDKDVACKIFLEGLSLFSTMRYYQKEVEILSKINKSNSDNVVKIVGYTINTTAKLYKFGIMMEYMPLGSLDDMYVEYQTLKKELPDWLIRKKMIGHAARGLGVLHESGYIHCDVKSANFLVVEQRGELVVKIADFGLSVSNQPNNYAIGTPYYVGPEVFNGRGVSFRSDIFSLGITALEISGFKRVEYFLLPLKFADPKDYIKFVCDGGRPSVSEVADPSIKNLITLCMAAEPSQRPTIQQICAIVDSDNRSPQRR